MRLVTWNVNSVRARQQRLLALLQRHEPDVVCLQELKCEHNKFPYAEVEALGYHAVVYGQKTYNGVAILARQQPEEIKLGFANVELDEQARLISAVVDGVRVLCVYVPNGSDMSSDKYAYKLRWLNALVEHVEASYAAIEPLVLCGDFNIAPDDRDIAQLDVFGEGIFSSPEVRGALQRLQQFGLVDVFRKHHDEAAVYSWWDYRQLAFPKNKGLRIDLIYASEPLAAACTDCFIDRDERRGKQPSDHAPVVADFAR